MRIVNLRRILGWALFLLCVFIFGWGMLSPSYQSQIVTIHPTELQPPESDGGVSEERPDPSQNAAAWLILEWPVALRLGDAGMIRLIFTPFKPGTPGSEEIQSESEQLSNSTAGFHRALQARLDLPGVRHTPTGEISQALVLDHPMTFLWNLRPEKSGMFDGKTWLHIRFIPVSGEIEQRKVLVAENLEILVVRLFGLSGSLARALGAAGMLLGAVFGLEGLLTRALQAVARRTKG